MDMEKSMLQEIVENMEGFEVRSYSGRGMYGETCLGVTVTGYSTGLANLINGLLLHVAENELSPHEVYELTDEIDNLSTDSMGRGTIYYFPGVKYVEG